MNKIYCVANNSGKNFITNKDKHQFYIKGHYENLWELGDTKESNLWIERVSGIKKTKEEAQQILDEIYNNAIISYNNDERRLLTGPAKLREPEKIIL